MLDRFLGALPVRVDYRALAGGPLPEGEAAKDDSAIAAEARALMAKEPGLSTIEAVDRVRAGRGIAKT